MPLYKPAHLFRFLNQLAALRLVVSLHQFAHGGFFKCPSSTIVRQRPAHLLPTLMICCAYICTDLVASQCTANVTFGRSTARSDANVATAPVVQFVVHNSARRLLCLHALPHSLITNLHFACVHAIPPCPRRLCDMPGIKGYSLANMLLHPHTHAVPKEVFSPLCAPFPFAAIAMWTRPLQDQASTGTNVFTGFLPFRHYLSRDTPSGLCRITRVFPLEAANVAGVQSSFQST
jgi:hypothetical protein